MSEITPHRLKRVPLKTSHLQFTHNVVGSLEWRLAM
jgi:hypothetical protein